MTLTCACCKFTRTFENGEEAFADGWDCPPHSTGYVCCNLCPATYVVMNMTHKHAAEHERWEKRGRPTGKLTLSKGSI